MALGQVTPGPVVITATFVGQRVAGLAGALVATISIFLPSLIALLAAEPSFRGLRSLGDTWQNLTVASQREAGPEGDFGHVLSPKIE